MRSKSIYSIPIMPVELRKRKAPPPPPEPPAKKKATKAAPKAKETVKETVKEPVKAKPEKPAAPAKANGASTSSSNKVAVGDTVDLATFGGEVSMNDGTPVTLSSLVEKSGSGVVLFTYPKASTPGCTKQACFFRDSYEPLTAGGLAIYGLSTDSPKANTTFKEKQKLQYPLLCDPKATLIAAIGLKKAPSGTQRGVFVIDKKGKVLIAEPGSPQGTVDAVQKLVEADATNGEEEKNGEDKEEMSDEEEVKANGGEAEDTKEGEKKEDKEEKDAEKEDDKEEEEKKV